MKIFIQDQEKKLQETTLLDVLRNELNRIEGAEINYDKGWVSIEQESEKLSIIVTFLFDNDKMEEIQVHSAPIKKVTVFEDQKRLL